MRVLFFTADWCPNCKSMYPIWNEIVEGNTKADYRLIDCSTDTQEAAKYKVVNIPAFLITDDNGIEIGRKTGYMAKNSFQKWLDDWL